MPKYLVEVVHIDNEEYDLPEKLQKFTIYANDTEHAIKVVSNYLRFDMNNVDDYEVTDYGEEYFKFTCGDAEAGLDMCFEVSEIEG